jgi:membrane-associated phospholipid phosphatase
VDVSRRVSIFRPVWPRTWWYDVAALAGLVALTVAVHYGHFLGTDLAIRDWCRTHQPTVVHWGARIGNLLGQGGFFTYVCAALAVYWTWKRHSIRPILPVILAFGLTFVSISVLKDITDLAAPNADLDPAPLAVAHPAPFGSGGVSYPSGHLANSFVWYGVLALLLAPWLTPRWRWVLRIAPPAILTVTTVYLNYHWMTDTIAGILLGTFLWRIMARVPWDDLPLGDLLTVWGWGGPALEEFQRRS